MSGLCVICNQSKSDPELITAFGVDKTKQARPMQGITLSHAEEGQSLALLACWLLASG